MFIRVDHPGDCTFLPLFAGTTLARPWPCVEDMKRKQAKQIIVNLKKRKKQNNVNKTTKTTNTNSERKQHKPSECPHLSGLVRRKNACHDLSPADAHRRRHRLGRRAIVSGHDPDADSQPAIMSRKKHSHARTLDFIQIKLPRR